MEAGIDRRNEVLLNSQSIHILGAGLNPTRPAHRSIHDLNNKGWRLIPVHPVDAGGTILGRAIRQQIDSGLSPEIVVFFLSPQRSMDALKRLMMNDSITSMPLVWFQPGATDTAILEVLEAADFDYVAETCIVEHILEHGLTCPRPLPMLRCYLHLGHPDDDGCSSWSLLPANETGPSPVGIHEWCGDIIDIRDSTHMIPTYIRSLARPGERLDEVAQRLTGQTE